MVAFIDMNSFFARCEQQANYYLRGRPVGICVYTGQHGCVIAASVEAKKLGVKTGMRLSDAVKVCPDLVPLETHPARYREFHVKIMDVVRRYCHDVIPKSIDEAILDLRSQAVEYKTVDSIINLGRRIKADIKNEVGDWLTCSIGIAPNAFLAKLASNLKKPDGLEVIVPENIDTVLAKMDLTHLPGIAKNMAIRLVRAGIDTPLKLRYANPADLKRACQSIIGVYWHYRLNFSEVDMITHPYKNMQAMRQLSAAQRSNLQTIDEVFINLCMTLEKRMMKQSVYAREVALFLSYRNGQRYKYHSRINPIQDGGLLYKLLKEQLIEVSNGRLEKFLHTDTTAIGVSVNNFVESSVIQIDLFEDNIRKDTLMRAVYDMKDKYGYDKLVRAIQLHEQQHTRDCIGFGSVKDMHLAFESTFNFNSVE